MTSNTWDKLFGSRPIDAAAAAGATSARRCHDEHPSPAELIAELERRNLDLEQELRLAYATQMLLIDLAIDVLKELAPAKP